jgi:hypothetical protein
MSAFNDFLYADVGDDKNGMSLTVLSALARQNVDPWELAADLSRLPAESAHTKLIAMLEAVPGHSALADRADVAARLIPLLPRVRSGRAVGAQTLQRMIPGDRSPERQDLSMVLAYFISLIFGLWFLSGFSAKSPVPAEAADVTTMQPAAAAREQP